MEVGVVDKLAAVVKNGGRCARQCLSESSHRRQDKGTVLGYVILSNNSITINPMGPIHRIAPGLVSSFWGGFQRRGGALRRYMSTFDGRFALGTEAIQAPAKSIALKTPEWRFTQIQKWLCYISYARKHM